MVSDICYIICVATLCAGLALSDYNSYCEKSPICTPITSEK